MQAVVLWRDHTEWLILLAQKRGFRCAHGRGLAYLWGTQPGQLLLERAKRRRSGKTGCKKGVPPPAWRQIQNAGPSTCGAGAMPGQCRGMFKIPSLDPLQSCGWEGFFFTEGRWCNAGPASVDAGPALRQRLNTGCHLRAALRCRRGRTLHVKSNKCRPRPSLSKQALRMLLRGRRRQLIHSTSTLRSSDRSPRPVIGFRRNGMLPFQSGRGALSEITPRNVIIFCPTKTNSCNSSLQM